MSLVAQKSPPFPQLKQDHIYSAGTNLWCCWNRINDTRYVFNQYKIKWKLTKNTITPTPTPTVTNTNTNTSRKSQLLSFNQLVDQTKAQTVTEKTPSPSFMRSKNSDGTQKLSSSRMKRLTKSSNTSSRGSADTSEEWTLDPSPTMRNSCLKPSENFPLPV